MNDTDIAVGALIQELDDELDNFQYRYRSRRNLPNKTRPTCNVSAHRASP